MKCTAKALIRLSRCPCWSESSLGTHSLCWFCHVAAHINMTSEKPSEVFGNCGVLPKQIQWKYYWDTQNICSNHPKILTRWLYHWVMRPKDVEGMANSVDPDQTAPLGAVWSGSKLFAQTYLSENLRTSWYPVFMVVVSETHTDCFSKIALLLLDSIFSQSAAAYLMMSWDVMSGCPVIYHMDSSCTKFIGNNGLFYWIRFIAHVFILLAKANITWTASSEFGTYSLCEQRRVRRACASAQSRQNLRCSLI